MIHIRNKFNIQSYSKNNTICYSYFVPVVLWYTGIIYSTAGLGCMISLFRICWNMHGNMIIWNTTVPRSSYWCTLVNAQPSECKFQKRQISKFLSIREYLTQFYNDTATISSQGLHHLQASTVKIKCSKPHQTSAVAYFTTSSMDVHPSLLPEATSVTKFDIS